MDEDTFLAGRPELPYRPGFEIDIRSHSPPQPFGGGNYLGPTPLQYRGVSRQQTLEKCTRMEIVMLSPPTEAPTSEPDSRSTASTLRITITKTLAVGPDHRAQVVVCNAVSGTEHRKPFTAVAKIYDPLYYSYWNPKPGPRGPGEKENTDTPYLADSEYSREAAAYERLRRHGHTEGTFTPVYHGSWTFSLPVHHDKLPHIKERQVRLVLMDYVDGTTFNSLKMAPEEGMDDSWWDEATDLYRMAVWAKVLEAEAYIYHAGLEHFDNHPRNVIILPKSDQNNTLPEQVFIIDWGQSEIWKKPNGEPWSSGWHRHNRELPFNPALEGWEALVGDYADWLPQWYFDDDEKRHSWLMGQFLGDKASQFSPVTQELTPGGEIDWKLENSSHKKS